MGMAPAGGSGGRGRQRRAEAGVAGFLLGCVATAPAQLADSAWPKFQGDLQNSGATTGLSLIAEPYVEWSLRLGDPRTGENHATPVLGSGNARLYVGGPGSILYAVDRASGTLAWTVTLGDGTGTIYQSPAVAADGSLFVGAWDNTAPYDGFCKIHDDGTQATVAWCFPMRRLLASPTITPDGLIIVGGQHESLGWGYYALEDLGTEAALAWSAAHLADPGVPGSTGAIAASPALSADGQWVFGGSYENHTFWQIGAGDGFEQMRYPLDFYCYGPSPVLSPEGLVFLGEGMSFTTPDEATQGKLYSFGMEPDQVTLLDSLPLHAGHLNSGTAAVGSTPDGQRRLYVPANGYGASSAELVAVGIDPDAPGQEPPAPLSEIVWRLSLGPAALAYGQSVVTPDAVIYVIGPASHILYAVRDVGSSGTVAWSLSLTGISRAEGWQPSGAIGPQGVCPGPDGTLYWNAVDGYLYAIRGWPVGDLNGDEMLTSADADWLVSAIVDPAGYALRFPEIDPLAVADFFPDGQLDVADALRMAELVGR